MESLITSSNRANLRRMERSNEAIERIEKNFGIEPPLLRSNK